MKNTPFGICICGLNGCGKSTLGRELSRKINLRHMDVEDYYFTDKDDPYAHSRTRDEVEELLYADTCAYPKFIFSAVNGNMSERVNEKYTLVIYLSATVDVRAERIEARALERFGERVLPGGDMYERERAFFEFAKKRNASSVEAWLETLTCPVLRLDGEKPMEENLSHVVHFLSKL